MVSGSAEMLVLSVNELSGTGLTLSLQSCLDAAATNTPTHATIKAMFYIPVPQVGSRAVMLSDQYYALDSTK